MADTLTPAMRQYQAVRDAHPDAVLLFQMGDFFECFFEDAQWLAERLGMALTSRGTFKGEPIPLAGFPIRQLDRYVRKLVDLGRRVAVCEQVEDARLAKGVVKRDVTRVITPGTIIEPALLDAARENFVCALHFEAPSPRGAGKRSATNAAPVGLAWAELSTGRFELATLAPTQAQLVLDRLEPAETLVAAPALEHDPPHALLSALRERGRGVVTARPALRFDAEAGTRALCEHFQVATLLGFGIDAAGADAAGVAAAGALQEFLRETQRSALGQLVTLSRYQPGERMLLDQATRRCLELTETMKSRAREGTLLATIDHTLTAMGSRALRDWLSAPLLGRAAIEARHDAVAELAGDHDRRRALSEALTRMPDLERLAGRLGSGRALPRELAGLRQALARLPRVFDALDGAAACLLAEPAESGDALADVHAALASALADEPAPTLKDGGVIRDGYDAALDAERALKLKESGFLADYRAREAERTGIATLKIGFNAVFGYYLEVSRANAARVPEDYARKQTLKNAERYVTPELKDYERRVLGAEQRAGERESELFAALRDRLAGEVPRLLEAARQVASLDALAALATHAVRHDCVRPVFVDQPVLELTESRHPVLEVLADAPFVPNDCRLDAQRPIALITGPNMAGKSTYIRQVALCVLLAQMGSFVPARAARLGIVDRIFTRLGSADEIQRGQSTFMVEMIETANILNNATPRSLIVLDEVGRGTSTFDGVAIAWAVTEHLATRLPARTLFATHYHELTEIAALYPNVGNWCVEVKEWGDDLVFVHRVQEGAVDKSYGIHVARLAGLPRALIERAKEILTGLEAQALNPDGTPTFAARLAAEPARKVQLTLFVPANDPVYERLAALDVNALTPLQALAALDELARLARNRDGTTP